MEYWDFATTQASVKSFNLFQLFTYILCKHTADDGCFLQSLGSTVTEMDLHFKECWMILLGGFSIMFFSPFLGSFLLYLPNWIPF